MLKKIIEERGVPALPKSGEEMLDTLLRFEYGYIPDKDLRVEFSECGPFISDFCAGKARAEKITVTVSSGDKSFSFPVYASIPTRAGKHPFFVCPNFRDCVPDRYVPTEEIIDSGFAILSFCYEDVTRDNGDFTSGLCGVLYESGERKPTDAGKIAVWSYAARCVMDYAVTREDLDADCACVCGHSRLGKTALLTAAIDKRFAFAHSNDSGCSGAAITRGKIGESITNICKTFPYWFSESYLEYKDDAHALPHDQHYLIGAIAPRYVYVSSAAEDLWADPTSEMLGCVAASGAYEAHGLTGLVCDDREPRVGDKYHEGHIGYHMRAGEHYYSREDWKYLIEFINSKRNSTNM